MKIVFNFLVMVSMLFIILLSSCSKQNNKSPQGYWTIANSRYNINYTSRLDSFGYSVLTGSDVNSSSSQQAVNRIYIWFLPQFPTKSGSYEMVNIQYTQTPLLSTQIGISGTLSKDYANRCTGIPIFAATGVENVLVWPSWTPAAKAEVTITNGKIRVDIPKTTTVYIIPCGIDSSFLAGVFLEK